RGDLRQDVDAVLVVLDHPLESTYLPLDSAQPLQVGFTGGAVAVRAGLVVIVRHVVDDTPRGYTLPTLRGAQRRCIATVARTMSRACSVVRTDVSIVTSA